MTLTREQKRQLLTKIDRFVQQKFYDPNFNGHDWPRLVAQYQEPILNSPTTAAFEESVTALLAGLHASGTGLLGRETKITPRNSIAASFRRILNTPEGDRWVFQDVQPGGVAARAGVKPADVLISVSGNEITPPGQPAFEMNESTPIVISRDGAHQEIRLALKTPVPKYRDNPYAEPDSIVAKTIPEDIGHLKVSLFPGKIGIDFANRLDEIFSTEFRDSRHLLIDLRGNPGGGVGGMRLMSYFTPGCQPIGYSFDRQCWERRCDPEKLPRFSRIPKTKWELFPLALKYATKKSIVIQTEGRGPRPFHGKIVLLVNEHSSGTAEMVAQFAKENRLATLVGMKTSGRLAARSAFVLGYGYRLTIPIGAYVSWQGNRIEGKGIEPDVPADWSYKAAQQGTDVQLERAIEITRSL